MQRDARWVVAGAVTVAAFAVPTWLCGAVALPGVLADPASRWAVASALGVALAALAALWGHGFATRPREEGPVPGPAVQAPGLAVQASGPRAVAIGGGNRGDVITGDTTGDAVPAAPGQAAAEEPAAARPASRQANTSPQSNTSAAENTPPAAKTVAARGDRAIAIGGDNSGPLSTGDHSEGRRP
ncbi:hypothetical protein ACFYNO_39800 [Kitasatospora sp. NPDC006697]|uniref:hypothetical protein n=1 Tax=Kitasatospora sp. NPDC006697 TaxID=3364020 RepID=UPI0036C77BA3